MRKIIIFTLLVTIGFITTWTAVMADNCDTRGITDPDDPRITKCITDLTNFRDAFSKANNYNKDQLLNWQNKVKSLQAWIKQLEKDIFDRQIKLGVQQVLLAARVKRDYVRKKDQPLLLLLFSSDNAVDFFQDLAYREKLAREDRNLIASIGGEIKNLNEEANNIKIQKESLTKQAEWLAGEISKAEVFISDLSNKIAALTELQQRLLAEKLAGLNIPRSAYSLQGGCVDDRNIDPGFSPRIAFFTFGVPNRVGLNQWGARGRAEAGQSAQTILSAYYNADFTTGYNSGINIRVTGTNEYGQGFNDTWNIEDYLKHLYEIPGDWPMEALKAQAIAARSYALAYTNNGQGAICPNQNCQVVKRELNSGNWQAAVKQTEGIVLTNGGQPIKAWFSSTHGGYVFKSGEIGWNDTSWTKHSTDINGGVSGFGDLFSNAYDKNSPWFYCDWGFRRDYNKTAWLRPEEVADIANVILLARKDSSVRKHLYQLDKPNPEGTDNWDPERVKQELSSRGGNPVDSVSDISIGADWNYGRTTTVNIAGNSFEGAEFKDFFNLRAPANIQIVGPLFNIERR